MKGKALGVTASRWFAASWLASLLEFLPWPAWFAWGLSAVTVTVCLMSLAALTVWAAWNVPGLLAVSPGRTSRCPGCRDGRDREQAERLLARYATPALPSRTESTVGGLRYMGPPPVVRATKVTYEMRGGTQLVKEIRVTERRMLPSGPVPGYGICGKCGNPMTQHLYYGSDCCLVDRRL